MSKNHQDNKTTELSTSTHCCTNSLGEGTEILDNNNNNNNNNKNKYLSRKRSLKPSSRGMGSIFSIDKTGRILIKRQQDRNKEDIEKEQLRKFYLNRTNKKKITNGINQVLINNPWMKPKRIRPKKLRPIKEEEPEESVVDNVIKDDETDEDMEVFKLDDRFISRKPGKPTVPPNHKNKYYKQHRERDINIETLIVIENRRKAALTL